MSEFEREDRYLILKLKDLTGLPVAQQLAFANVSGYAIKQREARNAPPLDCVVVESDWPEYEIVWSMIEARVTGQPNTIEQIQSRLTASEAECARLRHENTAYIQELGKLTVALDKLARLGNEPHFGNSIGNQIARAALRLPSPPPPQQSAPAQGENNA